MPSILSFDIMSAVLCEAESKVCLPDSTILLCIPVSAADAAAVITNGTKTLLANGLINFLFNGNPFFNNRPKSLPKNPPDWIILDNRAFDSLISADELFAKTLRRFAVCLLVNNNSCGKLVSSLKLAMVFDNNLKTNSVFFFYCLLEFFKLWIW